MARFPVFPIHGILMIVAWTILAPAAIWIMRYSRARHTSLHRSVWHYRLQLGALGCSTAAVSFAVGNVSQHATHFHTIFGLIMSGVIAVVAMFGYLTWQNRVWKQIHPTIGRLIPPILLVQIYTGLGAVHFLSPSLDVLFIAALVMFWLILFSVSECRLRRWRRRNVGVGNRTTMATSFSDTDYAEHAISPTSPLHPLSSIHKGPSIPGLARSKTMVNSVAHLGGFGRSQSEARIASSSSSGSSIRRGPATSTTSTPAMPPASSLSNL